jgi:hypothetical protein
MLLRQDGDAVIAIPQPSHAWLSGQMARAWGNDAFDRPQPFAEVCLAAELHDIGWFAWELAPTLDHGSGRPQTFPQLPPTVHVELWREGVARARLFGRYPALLVSRHADTIYDRFFDFTKATPENASAVTKFLDEQHALQAALQQSLAQDPLHGAEASPERVETNRLLVAALDWMSLQICWGVSEATRIPQVPSRGQDRLDLRLEPGLEPHEIIVAPWPFGVDRLEVRAEGKRLDETCPTNEALRAALAMAEPVLVTAVLRPR